MVLYIRWFFVLSLCFFLQLLWMKHRETWKVILSKEVGIQRTISRMCCTDVASCWRQWSYDHVNQLTIYSCVSTGDFYVALWWNCSGCGLCFRERVSNNIISAVDEVRNWFFFMADCRQRESMTLHSCIKQWLFPYSWVWRDLIWAIDQNARRCKTATMPAVCNGTFCSHLLKGNSPRRHGSDSDLPFICVNQEQLHWTQGSYTGVK